MNQQEDLKMPVSSSAVTCPTELRQAGDIVGCGSTNVSPADEEGFHDCQDCGLFFKMSTEAAATRKLPETMLSNKKPFEIPAINNEKLALIRYLNLNGEDDADYDKVKELERFKLDSIDLSCGYRHTVAVFEYHNERYHVVHAAAELDADVLQVFNSNHWRIKRVESVNQRASSPSPGM